jgi:hypothetical protein
MSMCDIAHCGLVGAQLALTDPLRSLAVDPFKPHWPKGEFAQVL